MFIAVDLKVVEGLASAVARAGAMSEDAVLAGLVRLWHRCWADGADLFSGDEIAGLFAFDCSRTDGSARALGALVAFGFLELKGELWRVCGAARYLRLKESRRRGGRAATANLKRGKSPGSRAGPLPGASRDPSPAPPGSYTESPNTEHRTPSQKTSRAKKPRETGDPRHKPMVDALCATFERVTTAKYPFAGRDAAAVKALLAIALEPTIDATWAKALASTGYPTVRTLPELVTHFAHFVGQKPAGVRVEHEYQEIHNDGVGT